jgi:DNA-binding MarR family transcriptional regulator
MKLQRALDILRTLDPELPMSVVVCFLAVAETGKERVQVRDIQTKTGLSQSSLSRALIYLGDRHWKREAAKGGLEMVAQFVDPEDRRARLVALTSKGEALARSLEAAVS